MSHELKPAVWSALYRMNAAGAPVDFDFLREVASPLRIHHVPDSYSPVFLSALPGMKGEFAIALSVNVLATASVAVTGVSLEAPWIPSLSWTTPCVEHPNHFCVHPLVSIPRAENLKELLVSRKLSRGSIISGVLLGIISGECPCLRYTTRLQAELVIEDTFGTNYRYPLTVWEPTIEDLEDWSAQRASAHEISLPLPDGEGQ